jgi:hypothetical protein
MKQLKALAGIRSLPRIDPDAAYRRPLCVNEDFTLKTAS